MVISLENMVISLYKLFHKFHVILKVLFIIGDEREKPHIQCICLTWITIHNNNVRAIPLLFNSVYYFNVYVFKTGYKMIL